VTKVTKTKGKKEVEEYLYFQNWIDNVLCKNVIIYTCNDTFIK